MPGVVRVTLDRLAGHVEKAASLGIPAVALFPMTPPDAKDAEGTEALNPENLMCRAARLLKREFPDLGLVGDVAPTIDALLPLLAEKSDSGHLERSLNHYDKARKSLDELAVGTPENRRSTRNMSLESSASLRPRTRSSPATSESRPCGPLAT